MPCNTAHIFLLMHQDKHFCCQITYFHPPLAISASNLICQQQKTADIRFQIICCHYIRYICFFVVWRYYLFPLLLQYTIAKLCAIMLLPPYTMTYIRRYSWQVLHSPLPQSRKSDWQIRWIHSWCEVLPSVQSLLCWWSLILQYNIHILHRLAEVESDFPLPGQLWKHMADRSVPAMLMEKSFSGFCFKTKPW